MKIYVRKTDGLVLNSYRFNKHSLQISDDVEEQMFLAEDYDILELDDPSDEELEYTFKQYYFHDGKLTLKRIPEEFSLNKEINRLKDELSDSDYKIIKIVEARLLGKKPEYNILDLSKERQLLRDKINKLKEVLTINKEQL